MRTKKAEYIEKLTKRIAYKILEEEPFISKNQLEFRVRYINGSTCPGTINNIYSKYRRNL